MLAPLCVVAGTLLPYLPHYLFNTLPFEDDLANYFWPVMHWVADTIRSGRLPLWTSDIYSGFPLFADSEAGTLFPLNWLLVVFNEPRGLLIVLCASLGVGALGMYAYARSLGVSRVASALAAWVWSLGGFTTGHLIHLSIINSAAPLPWLMLAIDRALVTNGLMRWRWLIAAASLHALQWLGGHIQPALMTWWLAGAYLVFRLYLNPMPGAPMRGRFRRFGSLCAASMLVGLVAFGLAAVQLLPTAELAVASARGAGADFRFGASYSFSPFDLITLISPFFFLHDSGVRWGLWANWETASYVGVLPLMLAFIGLLPAARNIVVQVANVRPGNNQRRHVTKLLNSGADVGRVGNLPTQQLANLPYFLAGVALFSLWLAAGEAAPLSLYRWVHALPLMNFLRAPARFVMLFDFSLALLAALGAHRLLSVSYPFERVQARRLAFVTGGVTILLISAIFGVAALIGANREATIQWLDDTYRTFPNSGLLHPAERLFDFLQWAVWLGNPRLAFAVLLLIGAALWTMLACPGRLALRPRRIFAVVLVLADLSYFAAGFWHSVPVQDVATADATIHFLSDSANGTRVFSWPQAATMPNRLLSWPVPEADGYSSLELRRQSQVASAITAYDNRLLDLLNVGLVILPPRATAAATATVPQPSAPIDPHAPILYVAQGTPLSQRTFALSEPAPSTHVRIISALEHAPQIAQGAQVAWLSISGPQRQQSSIPIRAGIETAEWALERPDVRGIARHHAAPIAFSFVAADDFNPAYTRHLYVADVPLAAGATEARLASTVQLTVAVPGINWLIYGFELLGPSDTAATSPNGGAGLDRFGVSSFELIGDTNQARIFRNRTVLARARLVTTATFEANPERLFARLTSPEFDPEREVLLEAIPDGVVPGEGPPQPLNPSSSTVSIIHLSDDRVEVRVQTDRDAYLVLADTWYEGWNAYDNGQPTPIYRANYVQRAVHIRAGAHTLAFVFEPWTVRAGFLISLLSMVAAALICLVTMGATEGRAADGQCA